MIRRKDIIKFAVSGETVQLCLKNSKLCNICGISYVPVEGHEMSSEEKRNNKQYKRNNLEYQFIGQITTCAASEWLFRDKLKTYKETRGERNKNPFEGDGGTDLPPYAIDVKSSRMRNSDRDMMQYNFPLRPIERHEKTKYISALTSFLDGFKNVKVYLMGWLPEENITQEVRTHGVFEGAHLTPVTDLNPLPSLDSSFERKLSVLGL